MHHKRSKMKPEEELPSPGAVSVQVRVVCFQKYKNMFSVTGYIGYFFYLPGKVIQKKKNLTLQTGR